jgi:hypothetical protein
MAKAKTVASREVGGGSRQSAPEAAEMVEGAVATEVVVVVGANSRWAARVEAEEEEVAGEQEVERAELAEWVSREETMAVGESIPRVALEATAAAAAAGARAVVAGTMAAAVRSLLVELEGGAAVSEGTDPDELEARAGG